MRPNRLPQERPNRLPQEVGSNRPPQKHPNRLQLQVAKIRAVIAILELSGENATQPAAGMLSLKSVPSRATSVFAETTTKTALIGRKEMSASKTRAGCSSNVGNLVENVPVRFAKTMTKNAQRLLQMEDVIIIIGTICSRSVQNLAANASVATTVSGVTLGRQMIIATIVQTLCTCIAEKHVDCAK